MFICKCGRTFNTQKSLNSHAGHCDLYEKNKKELVTSKYKNEDGLYACECGAIFNNNISLSAHWGHCKLRHIDKPRKYEKGKMSGWGVYSIEEQQKIRNRGLDTLKQKRKNGEIVYIPYKHTEETKEKISKSRQKMLETSESHCKWYEVFNGKENIKVQGTWEKE